jgi:hypothetical protein
LFIGSQRKAFVPSTCDRPTLRLPKPKRKPLDHARVLASLPVPARPLLEREAPDEPVYLLERSPTRADVGYWLRSVRVWLLALDKDLLLLAPGRRPLIQRVAYRDLRQSVYNHATGELLLGPARHLPVTAVRVSPLTAYQLLAQIHVEEPGHA